MSSPAWDIYSNALEPLQYGFPLWCPEPSPEFGEVRLGDVGYIDRGCFCFLFNTTRAAEDAVNRRGVPHGFVRLTDQPERFTRSPERTMQTVLCSEGIQSMTGTVPQATATPVDGSSTLGPSSLTTQGSRYQCNVASGALLLLPAHGRTVTKELDCSKLIREYILKHIPSWRTFARNDLGIDLEEKDFVFVSGLTMASEWGVIAFANATPECQLLITGGGFNPGEEQWHVTMSEAPNAMVFARIGPLDRVARQRENQTDAEIDQCIFLQTYRVKTRRLGRSLLSNPDHTIQPGYDGASASGSNPSGSV